MRKLNTTSGGKIEVTFFQRRPRKGFNFSMEAIFDDVRGRLKDRIHPAVKICGLYNNGYLTKLYNIVEAGLRQGKGVNHITGEVHFLDLLMKKKNIVLTVLDCGMVHRKKGFAKWLITKLYLTWPVQKAAYVTSISEITKQEIIFHTGCNPDKIIVVPVAVSDIYQPFPKAFNSEKPTILQIGAGYNKNVLRLAAALKGIRCHLIIIGGLNDEQQHALKENNIDYSNEYNIPTERVLEKYRECDILSFVSTFEGFGMPIVEANTVERVVLTSNLSSMPEVAADAAHLVDPYNIEEIRQGILRLIRDSDYREALLQNGRRNKERFKGDTIANTYYDVYRKINEAL